jgi:hypothetical protein
MVAKHKRLCIMLAHAELHTQFKLRLAVFVQRGDGAWRQGYSAAALFSLGCLEPKPASARLL